MQQHARARVERRTGRADVVHQYHYEAVHAGPAPERERVPHVRVALRRRQVGLRGRGADAFQGVLHRKRKVFCDFRRLIEAARALT